MLPALPCFLVPRFIVLAAPANRMIAASPADDTEIAFMRVCGGILAGSRTSEDQLITANGAGEASG